MGLATGEAELRDGDYFGAVLNRAARVMAAGHGGQILVADSTAVLLSGVALIDLGARRLRDIAKPVEVFQVLAVGLRREFPPLTTLDVTPGNLRPPTTSLVGREAELDELNPVRGYELRTNPSSTDTAARAGRGRRPPRAAPSQSRGRRRCCDRRPSANRRLGCSALSMLPSRS